MSHSHSIFVGRREELAALHGLWREAADGRLRVAVVEGEAGIGKTRLLTEALATAPESPRAVYRAACAEHERLHAFAPLVAALGGEPGVADPVRATIEAALTEPSSSIEGDLTAAHFRVIEQLLSLLEEEALRRPVVLAIEDLHWADLATIAAVRSIVDRLAFVPLAVVLTSRPVPPGHAVERLLSRLADTDAIEMRLGPLLAEDVERLTRSATGGVPDEGLVGFVGGARGNPLYLSELLDALAREGAIGLQDGRAVLTHQALPPDLPRTILRRISFLSEGALETLRYAAILGSTFAPADLAIALRRPVASVVPSLEECTTAGLLVEAGTGLAFRHDLIREALYQDMPQAVRAALHTEIAHALDAAGRSATVVAAQFAAAAAPGDRSAIESLRRAARETAVSPVEAVELLERAWELAAGVPDVRDEVAVERAEALVWAGRASDGEREARALLVRAPTHGERLRAVVLRALMFEARYGAVVGAVEDWLASERVGERERGRLLAAAALARSLPTGGSLEAALVEAGDALAIARRLDDDAIRFHALRATSHARGRMGDGRAQIEAAREALMIAERDPSGTLLREHPHLTLAQALLETAHRDSYALGLGGREGAVAEGEHVLVTGLRVRESLGTLWDLPAYLTLLAVLRDRQGRVRDGLAESEAAIAAGEESGTKAGLVTAHIIAAGLLLFDAKLDDAERHVEQAEALVEEYGPQGTDPRRARAQLEFFRGSWDRSSESMWSIFSDLAPEEAPWTPYGMAFSFAMSGHQERARAVAERTQVWADRVGTDDARFQARLVRAFAESDAEWLVRLVEDPPERGAAADTGIWLMTGGVLARAGREEVARRAFKRSIERLGEEYPAVANAYVAIARRFGIRIHVHRRARRPVSGWGALTDTERRVATLAATGLTNPQIGERLYLSRRTVQAHLRHVFQKLGISSRVELASAVARESPPE